MKRLAWLFLPLWSVAQAASEPSATHPSDYVRVLEAGPPSRWDEAVDALLGDDGKLNRYAVASVVRRVHDLRWETRLRVAGALKRYRHTLPMLWTLADEDPHPDVRRAAMDSMLRSHAHGLMDACRDLIELQSPNQLEALSTLVDTYAVWVERIEEKNDEVEIDPVLAPENGTPAGVFDRRYLGAVSRLLFSSDASVRSAALAATASVDTPGLRDAWLVLTHDIDATVRWQALWALADAGDARPCSILLDELTEEAELERARIACAPHYFLDYIDRYQRGEDPSRYRRLIEEGATYRLFRHPPVMEAMQRYANHPDPFLADTARTLLEGSGAEIAAEGVDLRAGVRPGILVASAFVSFVLGALLFVWAFRLYRLFVRVRTRPVSKIASLAMGPVALEGEVQPSTRPLRHPLTDEPCVYYAGADVDHPDARFFLVDDSGKVLVDPRRAVLFSDDGVLVAGERVHLVGHAERERERGRVVVGKDTSTPPLYRRIAHWMIEVLFGFGFGGFGRNTSVSKMLFTDPSRCFWIWDDLERRPMGETGDVLWLAASLLLAGAWIVVFAVSVLGMIDQEASATLAEVLGTLTS